MIKVFLLLAASVAASPALAANYYVSPTGLDTNAGTQAAPWKTLTKASAAAAAGDVVNAMSGTHVFSPFTTSKAGLTYRKLPGAKLQPANGTPNTAILWTNIGQNSTIEEFEVDGRTPDGLSSVRVGIYASPVGTGPVTLKDNYVHHVYQSVCGPGGAGLLSDAYSTPNAVVHLIDNIVHDVGPAGNCNTVHGIYASTDGNVHNNISYNNSGWGITTWHDAKNNDIVNNTTFNNRSGGISAGAGEWYHANDPWTGNIRNNISVNNPYGIILYGSAGTYSCSHNVLNGNTTATSGINCTSTVTTAPQFASYNPSGVGDYHLVAGSPGINQGTATNAPATDKDGVARPQGSAVDAGAYEYVTPAAGGPYYRQLLVGVPAYSTAMTNALKSAVSTPQPTTLAIVNTADSGHSGHAALDATIDSIRARGTIVAGYIHTRVTPGGALRPIADVKANIDGWVTARSVAGAAAKVHANAIFVDEGQRDCGPTAGSMVWRDYYREIYNYIVARYPTQPGGTVLNRVILNPGTAIADCYVTLRTAHVYLTFEGTHAQYASDWPLRPGNVFNSSGYRNGVEYNNGTAEFMHLVYGLATKADAINDGRVGFRGRNIRWIYVTNDNLPNPWDTPSAWLADQNKWAIWAAAE